MYGMVLMAAITGAPDATAFGGRNKGCDGGAYVVSAGCVGTTAGCTGAYAGCTGTVASAGCHGGGLFGKRNGCDGGGLFGKRNGCDGGGLFNRKHGCNGGCIGSGGCTGMVVNGGCTGVVVHSTPVVTPAPAACCDPCATTARRGLFGKKGGNVSYVASTACCGTTTSAAPMPATETPKKDTPKTMEPKKND
jgi:hypothetical protein